MCKELFFEKMIFMGLCKVSFVAYEKPVALVNDPFFKNPNIVSPFFGDHPFVQQTNIHKAKILEIRPIIQL